MYRVTIELEGGHHWTFPRRELPYQVPLDDVAKLLLGPDDTYFLGIAPVKAITIEKGEKDATTTTSTDV